MQYMQYSIHETNNNKVNEGNKSRLNILRNKIFSSANIGKLSNVGVSFYQYSFTLGETTGPNHVSYKCIVA